jgi:adenine-specific DNA-methyltransferase
MSAMKERLLAEYARLKAETAGNLEALQRDWTKFMRAHKTEMPSGFAMYALADDRCAYRGTSLANPHPGGYTYEVRHPVTEMPVKRPLLGWRCSRDTMDMHRANGRLLFGKDATTVPNYKRYLDDEMTGKLPSIIEFRGQEAADEIKRLFPDNPKAFPYPKPSALEAYLLSFVADREAPALDPFGGSGTTAHAVMQLNARDKGDRRFIIIERGNLANRDEYAVELTAERVRRALAVDAPPSGCPGPGSTGRRLTARDPRGVAARSPHGPGSD